MNLGFLASHRGSNMQSIIDACKTSSLAAKPVVVISNNGGSGALKRAESENIASYHVSAKLLGEETKTDERIAAILSQHDVDLVVLAGYMKRIGPQTLKIFKDRIVNIHPCLLPKYGGQGMYGMRVHEAVIAAGDTESGVTIHLVNDEYDRGAILAQEKVDVLESDTAATLAERVLALEHKLYVDTLSRIISGEIDLPGSS